MPAHLEHCLQSLQQLAYARIVREFQRAWNARLDPAAAEVESAEAHCRVLRCEQALAGLRLLLDEPGQIAQIKVARALYLRMLLESAPARLQSWSDSDNVDDMPKSHLFEWIAYDFERLELTELEGAMTPDEAASYARALDLRHSLREE